jgi:hypothetical protein
MTLSLAGRGRLPGYSSDAFFTRFIFLFGVDTLGIMPTDHPKAGNGYYVHKRVRPAEKQDRT